MNEARRILAQFFSGSRLIIPLKPKHENRPAAARRARNKHIPAKAARRESFKRFYRLNYSHKALAGMRREQRRAIIKAWWHEMKCSPS